MMRSPTKLINWCLLLILAMSARTSEAENTAKFQNLLRLTEEFRTASDRIQTEAVNQKISYCLYKVPRPENPFMPRPDWKTADEVKKFATREDVVQSFIRDAEGHLSKMDGVPVGEAMVNIFSDILPLDNDSFRVLRQTREYDAQNRTKFEELSSGLDKIIAELPAPGGQDAAASLRKLQKARTRILRISDNYGYGGLDQLIQYIQRDFRNEFAGRKIMNFGKCEGSANRVISIEKSLESERDSIKKMLVELNLVAAELDSQIAQDN